VSAASWIARLETEIARELGQAVTIAPGGEAPDRTRCRCDALEVPGARLALAADTEDLARVLVEGRLIDAGQADQETVAELWTGILASVAARLGGKLVGAVPVESNGFAEPCTLRLGSATLRLALGEEPARPGGAHPGDIRSGDAPSAEPMAAAAQGNFDLLLEVALDATLRFGSCALELRELLELGPGDVVELDRQLSDPVDLIVGDKIVARGEVVLVNGNFGLRVTEVAEPMRRLESIR
jgi:flagellar motor switch protein FliN